MGQVFMARSLWSLGRQDEALTQLHVAVRTAPHLREPWVELGWAYWVLKDYALAFGFMLKALNIKEHSMTFPSEEKAWGSLPYDIAANAAWQMGLKDTGLSYAKLALEFEPEDPRLAENVKLMEEGIFSQSNG